MAMRSTSTRDVAADTAVGARVEPCPWGWLRVEVFPAVVPEGEQGFCFHAHTLAGGVGQNRSEGENILATRLDRHCPRFSGRLRRMKTSGTVSDRLSRPPLQRMLRIHEQLKGNRLPNCSQLALDLEVNPKTVQRDIEFMRDRLDLPIEFDFRKNGFRYTAPVENFPTVQVTEQELIALFVAEKALTQYRGTPFERPLRAAFEKLTEGLTDAVSFRWAELDSTISFRSIGTTVADLELFESVSQAVLRSEELEFQYHKLNHARHEPRRVQPYHLGCIENQWYLFAFDLERQQMRTFVLGRMKAVQATGQRFTRPAEFSMSKHLSDSFGVFAPDGKPQEVRIRFDAFAARLVRERKWHASQRIKELPNGEIELHLKLADLTEIQRWILSWAEHAEVIAPTTLRRSIAATITSLATAYSSPTFRGFGAFRGI